jgi:hypothetical protein
MGLPDHVETSVTRLRQISDVATGSPRRAPHFGHFSVKAGRAHDERNRAATVKPPSTQGAKLFPTICLSITGSIG